MAAAASVLSALKKRKSPRERTDRAESSFFSDVRMEEDAATSKAVMAATAWPSNDQRSLISVIKNALAENASSTPSMWVIDPRDSEWLSYWDLLSFGALIFTAIVTPYEVSFLEEECLADGVSALFIINRLIDTIFVTDLLLQFCLSFPIPTTEGTVWVTEPCAIWKHYLHSWFTLDFLSCAVSAIDFMGSCGENNSLRVLRVLRALRLIKLMRLVRASRYRAHQCLVFACSCVCLFCVIAC
jgi:hypothetical protein